MASIAHAPCYVAATRAAIGPPRRSRDSRARTPLARSGGGHVRAGGARGQSRRDSGRARTARGSAASDMSLLDTLLEAARFIELQERRLQAGKSRPKSPGACRGGPRHEWNRSLGVRRFAIVQSPARQCSERPSRRPPLLTLNSTQPRHPSPRGLAPRKQRKPEIHRPQPTAQRNSYIIPRLKQQTTHLFGSVGHAHTSYLRVSTRIRGRGIDKPLHYTTRLSLYVTYFPSASGWRVNDGATLCIRGTCQVEAWRIEVSERALESSQLIATCSGLEGGCGERVEGGLRARIERHGHCAWCVL